MDTNMTDHSIANFLSSRLYLFFVTSSEDLKNVEMQRVSNQGCINFPISPVIPNYSTILSKGTWRTQSFAYGARLKNLSTLPSTSFGKEAMKHAQELLSSWEQAVFLREDGTYTGISLLIPWWNSAIIQACWWWWTRRGKRSAALGRKTVLFIYDRAFQQLGFNEERSIQPCFLEKSHPSYQNCCAFASSTVEHYLPRHLLAHPAFSLLPGCPSLPTAFTRDISW